MPVSAGSRLGPYEVLSPLGSGGMGEVWRARDSRLSREVAIKVLPAAVASDRERLQRFEKEARSSSALNHPSIVTIYDVGETDGVSWIAMELVEGKTIRELLVPGALPVKRLLQLAAPIAEGLAKAHEAGIVHRDLKPENVMATRDGFVKILDFGLAKLTSTGSGSDEASQLPTMAGTTPGVVVGTVGYMSPEQASGEAIDFRSDQFSFGSVLYEMAAGKRAFQKKTAIDTLGAILNEEPQAIAAINPQVPAPLRWIVERCLSKDPEGRYGTTRDLARDLATVRDHLSEASGTTEVTAPERRRPRLVPAALSAAALALGLLAGKLLWESAPPVFPRFQQLTFGEETIQTARFAPDGQTVVYGVVREGKPFELLSTRVGAFEYRPLGLNADVRSISSSGEMAVVLGGPLMIGTLAVVPLAGGAPRELLENVIWAEWSPDAKGLAVVTDSYGKPRLEFPIGKVLLERPGGFGRPRFSRTGKEILTQDGSDSLVLVDSATGKVKKAHEGISTSNLWSTVSDDIWITVPAGSTTEIRALKPGGADRLAATLPGEFIMQDIAADDRILAERVLGRNRMIGQVPGATREKNLSWLNGSDPADISPDGKAVLFTEVGGEGVARVYLRHTDGSPAIRLGDGDALALSPDGKWALSRAAATTLLPTGAGKPRPIAAPGVDFDGGATFSPDGRRLLLSGKTKGGALRVYAMDAEGGEPHPVTPEGIYLPYNVHSVSPDGKFVVAQNRLERTWSLYPLEKGALPGKPIPGLVATDKPIRWGADGRSLFVWSYGKDLSRLDLESGRRDLVKEFPGSTNFSVTPDGRGYVYAIDSHNSNLYLIDGLKP